MKLKYNPFPIIFLQGDDASQLACLDFLKQGNSPRARACLSALMEQQRFDGGFVSHLNSALWGIQETIKHALLILNVGILLEDSHIQNAVRFVLGKQRIDGGWCENPFLKIPYEQIWLSNQRSVTWLIANVIELLWQAEITEQSEYQGALTWLRNIQNPDGSWSSLATEEGNHQVVPGDPDTSAQLTFLMGELFGEEDRQYITVKELFGRHLDECVVDVERGYRIGERDGERAEIDVYHLTHLLLSWYLDPPRRLRGGYDIHDPRVRRMMEMLINIQCQDGGWRPFRAQESFPVNTILALKVLVLSGMLVQEDLDIDIKVHAS
jgi:hypothetical protein